jgi:hypothetical protein
MRDKTADDIETEFNKKLSIIEDEAQTILNTINKTMSRPMRDEEIHITPNDEPAVISVKKVEPINFTFFKWKISTDIWKSLSLFDKIRAKIFFKIILPKSELIIKDEELHL